LQVADLVLPVFAVVLTGWIVGATGYLARSLSDALIHFACNIAMPGLLIVTIAQEPAYSLIDWRFLIAFGGGSLLCFALVFGMVRLQGRHDLASQTMYGMAAAMTNADFVALPVLQAIYGERAVLPAAIATVFVAVVMFPVTVVLLELDRHPARGPGTRPPLLPQIVQARHHAIGGIRPVGRAWAPPALHHSRRGLRCGADRQDGLHPCRRISLRRDHGRRHRICHQAAVHRVASSVAVRVVRMGAMTMAGPASGWPR
jgi:predicted permease